ncbi:C6 transcription factor (Mut3) [Pseudohyphozyma bogoriensis]|nr:C6 transcription factor (Mut3) [Pseudohyphozyma bogoriensis]
MGPDQPHPGNPQPHASTSSSSSVVPTLATLPSSDHCIPCSMCVKRGQAAACQAPAKRKRGIDPAQELDERRTAALSEIELFRNTLDTLRSRLPNLDAVPPRPTEYFVANSSLADGDGGELDDVTRHFGKGDVAAANIKAEVDGLSEAIEDRSEEREREGRNIKRVKPTTRAISMSRSREREGTATDPGDSAAVDAAVDLEYAEEGYLDDARESISKPYPPSPVSSFPDGASLLAVAPTITQEDALFRHGVEFLGWHHRVFHGQTFYKQVAAFWDLGAERFDKASPAWLALYFALVSVSAKLLGIQEQRQLGWTEEETSALASKWFACCISNLYRHNFLEHHDIFSLQAIAVLALSGRDAGSPSLIANLLSSGLSIAQDLGLHKLPPDAKFYETQMAGKSTALRSKILIDREIKKRVFYALVFTDYFSIPFRSSWVLGKVQISTPLPLNLTDDDLLKGEIISRTETEFTPVSWLLQYLAIGQQMCDAFEQSQKPKSDGAYQAFLKIDQNLASIVENPPKWLTEGGRTAEKPKAFDFMRSTFLIAVHHKILCIHRPYLYRPYKGTVTEFSRRRIVESARAILREAPKVTGNRIWTSHYHLAAASFIVILELLDQSNKAPLADLDEVRQEINKALPSLEALKRASTIAASGLSLVHALMLEEEKVREDAARKAANQNLLQPPPMHSNGNSHASASNHSSLLPVSQPPPHPSHYDPAMAMPHYFPPMPMSPYDYLGNSAAGSPATFQHWWYDMGIENSEQWLNSALSGPAMGLGMPPAPHDPNSGNGDSWAMGYPMNLIP